MKAGRMGGVGEHPFGLQRIPRRRKIRMHGHRRQVVVIEACAFQFGFGHVEAERAHQMQLASGARDEPDGVAGVLGYAGLEEHESKHPVHSAITFAGRMVQVDDEQIVGEDFSDARLDQQEWNGRNFLACTFRDADLSGVKSTSVVFTECDFTGTDLTESVHVDVAFRSCTFTRTNLQHSVFRHSTFIGSTFVDCRLRPATYDEVDFTLVGFGGADLRGVDLTGCRFGEANLVNADLRKATLTSADLTGARATGAKLDSADLRSARVDANLWVAASLAGARIELIQAAAYAQANGLSVEG